MNKSKNFSGQPITKQVLDFILPNDVHRTTEKHNSDRHTKKFTTYEHLATMICTAAARFMKYRVSCLPVKTKSII
ncbi:DUF4372 domain-containing protein [Arenibacter algicola]|uniref:DUF4372 domain-containing protein n=1 Tax=Arenibacter algicola TaxID=616991 RepID=UPI000B8E26FE